MVPADREEHSERHTVKCQRGIGRLRALYDVEGEEVVILIVGRKDGNMLIVEGEEFHGHQDNPVKPPGKKPKKDPQ